MAYKRIYIANNDLKYRKLYLVFPLQNAGELPVREIIGDGWPDPVSRSPILAGLSGVVGLLCRSEL